MKLHHGLLSKSLISLALIISLMAFYGCHCNCPEDCANPDCDCYPCDTPPPPPPDPVIPPSIWTSVQTFDKTLLPTNLIIVDSLNLWMTALTHPYLNAENPVWVFNSKDGGKTWKKNTLPSSNRLVATQLSAIDGNNAWINLVSKGLYKTSDGGNSWTLINESPRFKDVFLILHFFDAHEGIGLTVADTIGLIRTMDGGITWNYSPFIGPEERIPYEGFYWEGKGPIEYIGDTVAFCTGLGRLFMSYDRGLNWKVIAYDKSAPYEDFTCLALKSSKEFALTSDGKSRIIKGKFEKYLSYPNAKVISTIDGGATWQPPAEVRTYGGMISSIPGNNKFYIVTRFKYMYNPGGTFLSKDNGLSFTEIDTLFYNINISSFYSIYHGFGATWNFNDDSFPGNNFIASWNPEVLFIKKILE